MGSIRQFAGQTITYGLGSILPKLVFWLLVSVVLTRLLGGDRTHEFGIYGELYGYTTVLLVLFSLKLDTALFRYGNKKENFSEAFNTTASLVVLSCLVLLVFGFSLAQYFADLLGEQYKPYYIKWFTLILAFDIMSLIPYAKLRLQNKAKTFALLKIFNAFFSSILIIFFLFIVPKYSLDRLSWIPNYAYSIDYVFLTNVITSCIVFTILMWTAKGFKFKISQQLFKKIMPYVLPLVVVGMCNNFIQYNGAALIKYFLGKETILENLSASGIFDASRRIAVIFAIFIGAFNYAAEPFFFNNSSESDKEKYYGKICSIFVLLGGVIILGVVLGIDLFQHFIDVSYRESVFVIPILMLAYLFLGIYHNISIWYKLSDNTKYGAYISIIGVIITLAFSIAFMKQIGYVATAWANLITYFVMVIFAFVLGQRHYPISYPVGKILRTISFIVIILVISHYLTKQFNGIVLYLINTLLFTLYCVYVWLSEKTEWSRILFRNN